MDPPKEGFSPEQIKQLSAPLDRSHVKQRQQGGSKVSYVEGWHAINEANRILGFDAWSRETLSLRCVSERERTIGQAQKAGWGVTYSCTVRITVSLGNSSIVRDGSGAGHGIDVDLGQAHESALKEAETDAMKRALMTLGNPFGLALYDKEQKEVEGSLAGRPSSAAAPRPPQSVAPPPAEYRAAEPVRRAVAAPTTAASAPIRRRGAPVERPTNTPPPVWQSSQPADPDPVL
jgi:DNA recombination protein Rad52